MMRYNCSANKENYSQRNNRYVFVNKDVRIYSGVTCAPTSMIQALDYAGFKIPTITGEQPEDSFTKFMVESSEIDTKYKSMLPVMWRDWKDGKKDAYAPHEIHKLLAYGANVYLGTEAVIFREDVSLNELTKQICVDSLPAIISGCIPYNNTKLNHVVTLVGFTYDDHYKEDTKPRSLIIDDPYGDLRKNYAPNSTGNDIEISFQYFIKNFKPLGKEIKWAHLIQKPIAVV